MATVYTNTLHNTYDNLYYRAKCVYSTSQTNTTWTVTATVTLQYYGTYQQAQTYFNGAYVSVKVGDYAATDTYYPKTSKSSWTDFGSSVSSTKTYDRGTSDVTYNTAVTFSVLSVADGSPASKDVSLVKPALQSYTVSYNANGGTAAPSSQTKYYGVSLTLRWAITHDQTSPGNYTVTLKGNGITDPTALTSKRTVSYTFSKWKATNGTLYDAYGTYTANAATTMTAQWTTTETRASVTFPSPTRSSYTFKRWNTNTSDTGTGYNGGSSLTPTGNITVYAIWNAQIAYNANGGTGAPATQTKTFGSTLNLQSATPTRIGYTFAKWNTAANGSGADYQPSQQLAASDNTAMTLYAQWTANVYTISFNANGGTNAPASISKTYGQSATIPTDKPTRIGHTFMGWALSSSAETAQWLAGSNFSEAITADTPLYAVWRDDYESPSITTLRAYRCGFEPTQDTAIDPDKTYYERSGSGTSEDPYIYTEVEEPDVSEIETYYELIDDDEAGYARVEATWSIDTSVDEGVVNSATMTGTITPEGQQAQAITFQSGYQGTSGNAVALVDGLDVDTQYTVTVTVTDIKGASAATSRTVLLLRAFYIFDFGSQGNAVGIGRAAPQSGMEVGYPATFDDTVNLYDELQFNGEQAYPTFSRSSWSTSSDQTTLPVTPCFVHDTTSGVTYWCDGTTIANLGYLPLSGGTMTDGVDVERSNVNMKASDNGVTAETWLSALRDLDTNGYNIGFMGAYANPNGTMGYEIHAYNRNTSGTQVGHNYMCLRVDKSGARTYTIADPAAFRVAIGSPGAISANGYYGLTRPDGNTSDYLRAPQNGFIPYASGGSGNLGTSSWPWNYIYGKNIYQNGTKVSVEGHTHAYVPTSGGTVSADFTLNSSNGTIQINHTGMDISLASRSSDQYGMCAALRDKNGRYATYLQTVARTDGSIETQIGTRCYNGGNIGNIITARAYRNSTYSYYVTDPAKFRSAIGAAASSDRRLKSDISPLGEDAVSFVDALEPCVYTINGERQVGLIAQDVHEADPWDTGMAFETEDEIDGLNDWEKMEDGSPTWKLDYIRVIPPLVAAVQGANRRIESLESEVAELKALVAELTKAE